MPFFREKYIFCVFLCSCHACGFCGGENSRKPEDGNIALFSQFFHFSHATIERKNLTNCFTHSQTNIHMTKNVLQILAA